MRLVFGAVLIAGVGLAGFAVFQTQKYISQMQTELAEARRNASTVEMVNVFVTAKPLRYGQQLTREDVRVAPFPSYAVPTGAYTDVDALFPNGSDTRIVLRAMEALEPIMTVKLTEPGKQAGITSHLSPGMRAFTIPVNQTSGVAGFLRPGDHVDVFWTGRSSDQGEVTQMIQSHMRLIAVDQSADMDRTTNVSAARTVTVEATPRQAAALAQAQGSGRLSLALIGVDDERTNEQIEMTQDQMLGIVREERRVEVEQKCHIRTRRGGDMVLIEIPCTN
ncbi:Flp pilus assembly protein CpaB [Natronohydrobacter thiooxidans]|uniref:Flp pilus assembly protein CpaB n=1 Tax=Natronohydrobacter thiooxidans TaxID=87172 RepID=UPI0008FF440C|nr:Flp pilus assembly protein CpaB [Natronohydrobacter thiooxidans]